MRLTDKWYNFLKWFALVAIPATEALWLTVGKVWNFPYLTEIGATIAAIGLFIATLIGVSTKSYNDFVEQQSKDEPEDAELFEEVEYENDEHPAL